MVDFWQDMCALTELSRQLGHDIPGITEPRAVRPAAKPLHSRAADDPYYDDTPRQAEPGDGPEYFVKHAPSRHLLKALFDCGFERDYVIENRGYLRRGRTVVAVVVDPDDPLKIRHLAHGQMRIDVSDATDYVREHWS